MMIRKLAIASILLSAAVSGCKSAHTAAAPADGRTFSFEGRRVYYQSTGASGPAIVFVHGWSSDHTVWQRQVEALRDRARLILIDLPGHGASEEPRGAYSMELFARAVEAAMDDAGVRKAILVGHSNGTPVIRQCARRMGERIHALVAVDGALRAMFKKLDDAQPFLNQFRAPEYKQSVEQFVRGMCGAHFEPSVVDSLVHMAVQTPQSALIGGLEAAVDPTIWKDDRLTVPLVLVTAKQPFWSNDYYAYVRSLAPHAEITEHSGVSHFLMMEQPETLNVPLRALLDDVAQGRPRRI